MGRKGEETKQKIADCTKRIFIENGFQKVTMQDVCKAAQMSRGGVYRHFSSTAEIVVFIITQKHNEALEALKRAKARKIAPDVMLGHFINSRFAEITDPKENFGNVVMEFVNSDPKGAQFFKEHIERSISIVTEMICMGCEQGIYECDEPEEVARHILWMLEGISRHCLLFDMTKEELAGQMKLINQLLNKKPR